MLAWSLNGRLPLRLRPVDRRNAWLYRAETEKYRHEKTRRLHRRILSVR